MKKILAIVAVSLIAVLTATLITLSFVKTNFNQLNVNSSDIQEITVYYGTKEGTFGNAGDQTNIDVYNELISLYNQGTKEPILTSLFQGAYSASAKPEITRGGGTISPSGSDMYLRIGYYTTADQVVSLDGQAWIDEEISADEITYNYVWVSVVNSNDLVQVTAYYEYIDGSVGTYNYSITFLAHHSALYDYILDLSDNDYLI